MRKILIISAFICHLTFIICHSALAVNGSTTDPGQNLFSARQLGMGGVSVNFADDGTGVFLNPSQLTGFEFPQFSTASRRISLDETQQFFAGWAMPTSFGTFGLGYAGLWTGGSQPTTTDPVTGRITTDPSGEAGSYGSSLTTLVYANKIPRISNITVGGALKMYSQQITGTGGDRGSGTALDLSATYKPNNWLTTGIVLQNILGGSINWSSTQDKLGGYYKLGVAANILGPSHEALRAHHQPLKAGLDLDLPSGVLSSSSSLLYHLGLEYTPIKNIFLRAGLNQEAAGSGLTFGVGLINSAFRFDYAYAQRAGLPGDNPNYFSLSYIGDRVMTIDYKLKSRKTALKILYPPDRLITDQDKIQLSAEAAALKVIDQKRTWTVISVSATFDAFDITEPENLYSLFLNGKQLAQQGTFEIQEPLNPGRNVFQLVGFTTPEPKPIVGTVEAKVLRISPFSDAPITYWAIEPISLNVILGLITGYPDNTFKPDKGITRAELVSLLVRSLGIRQETLDEYSTYEAFKDVKPIHWAAKFISYGNALKLVSGYPDGTFKPNKVLSRVEAIAVLARYAGLSEEANVVSAPYPDLKPDFWGNKYIVPAKVIGMLKFFEGKELKPMGPCTRAEACEILYRVPSVQKKVNEFWETGIISASR